jgi:hypothetical protein
MSTSPYTNCKGCSASVRLAPGEVDRLVAEYLGSVPDAALCDGTTAARRLSICQGCEDLRHGTTCRHCGCLVEVRVRLSDKTCPAPSPRWT